MTSRRDVTPLGPGFAEPPEPAEGLGGGFISLSFLKAALRRRRWVWITTAALGFLIGASIHIVVEKPKYSAATELLVVTPPDQDPTGAVATDASLVETNQVAKSALEALNIPTIPATPQNVLAFLSTYSAVGEGDQILKITATGPSPAAAVIDANAVANAFLPYYRDQMTSLYHDTVDGSNGLTAQITATQQAISQLNAETSDPNGQLSANQIKNLQVQLETQAGQLSALNTGIASAKGNLAQEVTGTKVVDPATALAKSRKKVIIKDAAAGLIGGLLLGVALVLGQALLSDRLRRRDEIAEALGAPVELSVGHYRRPFLMRKRRLATSVTHPSPEMRMVARRLSSRLEQAPGAALAVVSVECSELAALAVASVARSLAEEGGRVTVVDLAEGRPLQSLFELPELDPDGPGEVSFHSAPEPKKSFLARAEEWRLAHFGRHHSTVRHSSPRRRPTPSTTTTRPVVSPTSIRDPLGSWAAWDMRHESVSKWSRDGSGQYRAWGSFRPPEALPANDTWEPTKIHELVEPAPSAVVEEPLEPDARTAQQDDPYDWEEEGFTAQPDEGEEAQPSETSPVGALSRIHPSPVPLVAKRGSVTVVTGPDDPSQIGVHRSNNGVDAVLVLATVNPAFGANHIASWATDSVVMISAGAASATRLAATAQMLESGGIRVNSAILVGADRHDETIGVAGTEQATGADQDGSWDHKRTWGSRG
jgi:capsular polysaccharide biosynthesis protein